jgi:hypothetical protein
LHPEIIARREPARGYDFNSLICLLRNEKPVNPGNEVKKHLNFRQEKPGVLQ